MTAVIIVGIICITIICINSMNKKAQYDALIDMYREWVSKNPEAEDDEE